MSSALKLNEIYINIVSCLFPTQISTTWCTHDKRVKSWYQMLTFSLNDSRNLKDCWIFFSCSFLRWCETWNYISSRDEIQKKIFFMENNMTRLKNREERKAVLTCCSLDFQFNLSLQSWNWDCEECKMTRNLLRSF